MSAIGGKADMAKPGRHVALMTHSGHRPAPDVAVAKPISAPLPNANSNEYDAISQPGRRREAAGIHSPWWSGCGVAHDGAGPADDHSYSWISGA